MSQAISRKSIRRVCFLYSLALRKAWYSSKPKESILHQEIRFRSQRFRCLGAIYALQFQYRQTYPNSQTIVSSRRVIPSLCLDCLSAVCRVVQLLCPGMPRMWKMVRFKGFKALLPCTIALVCLCTIVAADDPKFSTTQTAKRERDFEKIVDILSTIVDLLTGSGRLTPPSSSSYSPNPSPTPSPSQDASSPSPIPSTSPAPSKTPSVSQSPSPSPEPEPQSPDESVKAPDKPGSTKIPGVPYAIFNHDAPSKKAKSAVILLHGLGGEANEMVPIMNAIQEGMFPNTRFVIPEANEIYVSKPESKTNGWFNAPDSTMDGSVDRASQIGVANYVDRIGDHLEKQGIDRGKIVVFGYSQGSTVALTTYLRHKWGGVLAIAGFMSLADSYPAEMTDDSQGAPGVLVAGKQDKVVPVDTMRTTAAKLEELGRDVSYVEIAELGHDVIASERITSLATGLLNRVIATFEEPAL